MQSKPNALYSSWVPGYKKEVSITLTKTVKCKRKQFLCVPACGITIHKSQGGTLVYVAMSSVTNIEGLHIIMDKDTLFIFKYGQDGNDSQTMRDIHNKYVPLHGHALQTITKKAVKLCDNPNNAGQTIVTNLNSRVCLLTPQVLKKQI